MASELHQHANSSELRCSMHVSYQPTASASTYLRVLAEVLPLDAGFLQVRLPVPHVYTTLHRQQWYAMSNDWDNRLWS